MPRASLLLATAALASAAAPAAAPSTAPSWLPKDLPDVLPRAGQYMSFATLEADPILTGLAWNGLGKDSELRLHAQHRHRLQAWGWRSHDGRSYGSHFVGDALNRVVRACEGAWQCGGWGGCGVRRRA